MSSPRKSEDAAGLKEGGLVGLAAEEAREMVHDLPRAAHGKHLLAVGHARGGVHALRAVAEARREHVALITSAHMYP